MASHYAPRKARFGPLKKIVLGILQFVLGLAVLLAALWGIFTLIAKHQSFVESYYQVQSDKLTSNVRVVQLSDLHLHEFGNHNADLIERITALKPDIIAITGDMNDKLVDDYSVVTRPVHRAGQDRTGVLRARQPRMAQDRFSQLPHRDRSGGHRRPLPGRRD